LGSINIQKKRSFGSFFPGASDLALDLLRKLLIFNPTQRLTAEEALKHKYVEQFHSPEEEITCDHVIEIAMDDNKKFTIKEYRDAIYADIAKKKKDQRKKLQQQYLTQLGVTPETNYD
jgi:mitogen-activated protein kinase 15